MSLNNFTFDDSISENIMFVFKQFDAFKIVINNSRKDKNSNNKDSDFVNILLTLISAFAQRTKQFVALSFLSNRKTRMQIEKFDCKNYKKLNINKFVVNNVYYVKQVLKTYLYIIRALYVLQIEENYKLNHISKSISYKKIKTFFYWSK